MKEKKGGQRRRIETIDISATPREILTRLYSDGFYTRFICRFFFFLAGLSVKPRGLHGRKAWGAFLYKNLLALMVSYLVWGLFMLRFRTIICWTCFMVRSWEALTRMDTLISLWYLPCFFVSRMIVQVVVTAVEYTKAKNVPLWCGVAALLLLVSGLMMPHPENGVFWCADIALAGSGFILLGIAVRKAYLIMAQQKTLWLVISFLGSVVLFCCGSVFRGMHYNLA